MPQLIPKVESSGTPPQLNCSTRALLGISMSSQHNDPTLSASSSVIFMV